MTSLNKFIDHTLLKPEASADQIGHLIDEAIKYDFMSVCIQPIWVEYAAEKLKESDVKVCTVIGFPLGANLPATKAVEAAVALNQGADEIDMVVNLGAIKSGDWDLVKADIKAVNDVKMGRTLKVIIETSLLTEEEKIKACQIAQEVGADFVKTSTGFSTGGATIEDVKLMRQTVGPDMGVKASGGIKNLSDAEAMIQAGATRLGTSNGVAIMEGKTSSQAY